MENGLIDVCKWPIVLRRNRHFTWGEWCGRKTNGAGGIIFKKGDGEVRECLKSCKS